MKYAICSLKSESPYSQSKHIQVEKKPKESAKDYEERNWRERCNTNESGDIVIPPMAFCNSLKEAAKYLSLKIPGQNQSTYTKHFEAGVMVLEPLVLPYKKEKIKGEWLFVPSDGKRGGGKRVLKCFPLIPSWEGVVTYVILDDILTADIFEQVLKASGSFIGVGRFRPRNMGYYGRFTVGGIKWQEQ